MATTTMSPPIPRSSTTSLRRNPAAPWRHIDAVLVGCVAAVSALGALMVYSATRGPGTVAPYDASFLKRQALFVVLGFGVMLVVTLIDYRSYREWAWLLYGGGVVLLALVISPVGSESRGAQAWFQIGPFQLQPSEFAKVATIVGLAALAAQFRGDMHLPRLVVCLVIAGLPLALIMFQPDLGTALVLVAIAAGVLMVAGSRPRHLAFLLGSAVLVAALILQSGMLEEYQRCRLTSFIDRQDATCAARDATYNQDQSLIAIGAGGWFGSGLFDGSQTRLENVPEQHTDFIFTAVGEELGFVGAGTLLALFAIIVWRTWRTAQFARDTFGTLLCVGVLCMFLFQIFQNVGMSMGIMPITGIPLPFVSYGGSSTLAAFAAIGLVLNVHMRRFS